MNTDEINQLQWSDLVATLPYLSQSEFGNFNEYTYRKIGENWPPTLQIGDQIHFALLGKILPFISAEKLSGILPARVLSGHETQTNLFYALRDIVSPAHLNDNFLKYFATQLQDSVWMELNLHQMEIIGPQLRPYMLTRHNSLPDLKYKMLNYIDPQHLNEDEKAELRTIVSRMTPNEFSNLSSTAQSKLSPLFVETASKAAHGDERLKIVRNLNAKQLSKLGSDKIVLLSPDLTSRQRAYPVVKNALVDIKNKLKLYWFNNNPPICGICLEPLWVSGNLPTMLFKKKAIQWHVATKKGGEHADFHIFHQACLNQIRGPKLCPICRVNLNEADTTVLDFRVFNSLKLEFDPNKMLDRSPITSTLAN
jgi:hypothetical protein